MNCQDFELHILGMARAQLLDVSARRQTIAHIAECTACADRLAEQQALTAAVNSTAKSLRCEEASAHVEQSLLAAFRKQSKAPTVFRSAPIRTRQWTKRTFVAVAAIVLLILTAGVIRQWGFDASTSKVAETRATPTAIPKDDPSGKLSPSLPAPEAFRHVASERRYVRRPVPKTTTELEEAITGFIALSNENQLVPLESGQVLRVELPSSTLISMGLPITAEDVSKPILADLLVGQDGLARAIRFVRPSEANETGLSQQSNNK